MKIEPTRRIESKLFPGVSFAIDTWLERHRLEYYVLAESELDAYRDMQTERETITDSICERVGKPLGEILNRDATPQERGSLQKLDRRITLYGERVLDAIYLKIGLDSITGLTLGDETLSAEDHGRFPALLRYEIVRAIKREAGLEVVETENFELPTTSGAPADGQTNDTTAPLASEMATS